MLCAAVFFHGPSKCIGYGPFFQSCIAQKTKRKNVNDEKLTLLEAFFVPPRFVQAPEFGIGQFLLSGYTLPPPPPPLSSSTSRTTPARPQTPRAKSRAADDDDDDDDNSDEKAALRVPPVVFVFDF